MFDIPVLNTDANAMDLGGSYAQRLHIVFVPPLNIDDVGNDQNPNNYPSFDQYERILQFLIH